VTVEKRNGFRKRDYNTLQRILYQIATLLAGHEIEKINIYKYCKYCNIEYPINSCEDIRLNKKVALRRKKWLRRIVLYIHVDFIRLIQNLNGNKRSLAYFSTVIGLFARLSQLRTFLTFSLST
jgi:hypothetical protein